MEHIPLISVIVPVYKVEQYLHRCIDSILAQTYTNLEIILVDDGSPDRSGVICDEYAALDSRIRVVHQENGGLSAARNAGLDICTGEYLCFVDSDDYIEPDMLFRLWSRIGDCDPCSCGIIRQDHNGSLLSIVKPEREITLSGEAILCQHYSGENGDLHIVAVHVWARLYRSGLFRQLRFRKGIFFEDIHLMPYILTQCGAVRYLPYAGYHYLTNPDSITNRTEMSHQIKCYEDCFAIWNDHHAFYQNNDMDDLANEVDCARMDKLITHFLNDTIPQGCESRSRKLLYRTAARVLTKPIGTSRKMRYAAFCLLGPRGYRLLKRRTV